MTGSRIANRDFASDSPLVTVSANSLKSTGAIEIQQTLNKLPQVVASLGQGSNNPAGGGSESGFNFPGAQAIDLRGLGPNRVVVLMDGRRVARVKIERVLPIVTEAKAASTSGSPAANNSNGAGPSVAGSDSASASEVVKTHPDPAARTR